MEIAHRLLEEYIEENKGTLFENAPICELEARAEELFLVYGKMLPCPAFQLLPPHDLPGYQALTEAVLGVVEGDADKAGEVFNVFCKAWPTYARKRDKKTELSVLKKHKDWRQVVLALPDIIERQKQWRVCMEEAGQFVPAMPNMQTWLRNRRWEDVLPEINSNNNQYGNKTNQRNAAAKDEQFLRGVAEGFARGYTEE